MKSIFCSGMSSIPVSEVLVWHKEFKIVPSSNSISGIKYIFFFIIVVLLFVFNYIEVCRNAAFVRVVKIPIVAGMIHDMRLAVPAPLYAHG